MGEGFHRQAGEAHAEINALAQAGENARGAEVFVTLEPCSHHGRTPPCVDRLVEVQPARVVIAMQDPNPRVAGTGIRRLEKAGVEVRTGVCRADAERINRGFTRRMLVGRPWVTLKLATSLDGRIAMANGESSWITSAAARRDVHRLRLDHCAVLTGIGTVLADNPRLTARLEAEDIEPGYSRTLRQPVRIVLDSRGRLPADAQLLSQPGQTWQYIGEGVRQSPGVDRSLSVPGSDNRLDLASVLDDLGRNEINQVLVEAGGNLAASFVKQGLVDELVVYQSPDVMGASAQAMINLPDILNMSEKIKFELHDLRKIGRDLKLTLVPTSQASCLQE